MAFYNFIQLTKDVISEILPQTEYANSNIQIQEVEKGTYNLTLKVSTSSVSGTGLHIDLVTGTKWCLIEVNPRINLQMIDMSLFRSEFDAVMKAPRMSRTISTPLGTVDDPLGNLGKFKKEFRSAILGYEKRLAQFFDKYGKKGVKHYRGAKYESAKLNVRNRNDRLVESVEQTLIASQNIGRIIMKYFNERANQFGLSFAIKKTGVDPNEGYFFVDMTSPLKESIFISANVRKQMIYIKSETEELNLRSTATYETRRGEYDVEIDWDILMDEAIKKLGLSVDEYNPDLEIEIDLEDWREAVGIFFDNIRLVRYVKEHESRFIDQTLDEFDPSPDYGEEWRM